MQSFKFHFICPFHDFSAQLPYSSALSSPPPLNPLHLYVPCQQITEPNKIILIYMQDESSKPTVPWRRSSHRCPPARAVFFCFFFLFFYHHPTVNRFVGTAEGWGFVGPTKCFDSAWTRLQLLLSTKRVDERRI